MAGKRKGYIVIDREKCKGCGLCISFCPKKNISYSTKLNQRGYYPAQFDQTEDNRCNACTQCGLVCPDIAIEVYRES